MMTSISVIREKETGTIVDIAGISPSASAMDDYSQIIALLCAVMRQSGYNSVAVCLCITCSVAGSLFSLAFALVDLHRSISAVGIGFHYRRAK